MQAALKRLGAKAVRRNHPAPLVAFTISDAGAVSVNAAEVLRTPGAQRQIAAVKELRLAAENSQSDAKK